MSYLFDVSAVKDIVDKNGFYHGHAFLFEMMERQLNYFKEVLIKNIPPSELQIIKDIFFQGLFKKYYFEQRFLANKHLGGKQVQITEGLLINKKDNKDNFFVNYIGHPRWHHFSISTKVLFYLSCFQNHYVWVTKNTEIQIISGTP